MQNEDIFIKNQKNGFLLKSHIIGLNYRGSYEKDFLDFCFDNNIQIQKGKKIKYILNEHVHYYFSDFYYEPLNLIVEIKSSWTYKKYLMVNLIKEKATINFGYNYIFIIDKNYNEFKKFLK